MGLLGLPSTVCEQQYRAPDRHGGYCFSFRTCCSGKAMGCDMIVLQVLPCKLRLKTLSMRRRSTWFSPVMSTHTSEVAACIVTTASPMLLTTSPSVRLTVCVTCFSKYLCRWNYICELNTCLLWVVIHVRYYICDRRWRQCRGAGHWMGVTPT